MRLHLRFFAAAADLVGNKALDWEMPAGSTVAGLRQAVSLAYPIFAPLAAKVMVAVNRNYAQPEQVLANEDEVAFIPPVSGGAGGPAEDSAANPESGQTWRDPSGLYEVTARPLSGDAVSARVVGNYTGAAVIFLGTVREFTAGRRTVYLEYEAFAEMAVAKMKEIGQEIEARWPAARVAMSHRVGRLDISETAVVIAVATPHRADAFAAGRYAIDRLKEIVPIWKKEVWEDGSEWVGTDIHDHNAGKDN